MNNTGFESEIGNGDFPWTESGRRLLDIIQGIVRNEGGRHALAAAIMRENREVYNAQLKIERRREIGSVQKVRKNGFNAHKDRFIINHWATHTLKYIANELGVHLSTICVRGYELGLPERSQRTFVKPEKTKPVIVYYQNHQQKFYSITEAAKELNCSTAYINKALGKGYRVKGLKIRLADIY